MKSWLNKPEIVTIETIPKLQAPISKVSEFPYILGRHLCQNSEEADFKNVIFLHNNLISNPCFKSLLCNYSQNLNIFTLDISSVTTPILSSSHNHNKVSKVKFYGVF